jgi:hypothetical protein
MSSVNEISGCVMHMYWRVPIVLRYKVGSSNESPSKPKRLIAVDIGERLIWQQPSLCDEGDPRCAFVGIKRNRKGCQPLQCIKRNGEHQGP